MAGRRGSAYCAYGPVRGDCGHEHASERAAVVCVREDQAAHPASDREVCAIDPDGTRRPIWPRREE